jgi:hypothetical protein
MDLGVADRRLERRQPLRDQVGWRSAEASTRGWRISSGVNSSPRRRNARPAATRLPQTESGIAASRPSRIGVSHQAKVWLLTTIATIQSTASSVCAPCRETASRQPVEASSRGGDFQSSRQPVRAASTNWVWNSIRTGASRSEWANSTRALAHQPTGAAEPARLAAQDDRHQRQHLRREQQHRGEAEQRQHQLRSAVGQIGNSWLGSKK